MFYPYEGYRSCNDIVEYDKYRVPDRQRYIGLRQAHMLYRIDNNMIGTHQVHLANVGMIPGVNKILRLNTHHMERNQE